MRDQRGVLTERISMHLFQSAGDSGVQPGALVDQLSVVLHLLNERVPKDLRALGSERIALDEGGAAEGVEAGRDFVGGQPKDALQNGSRECLAYDSRRLQDLLLAVAESVDPSGNDRLHGRRDVNVHDWLRQRVWRRCATTRDAGHRRERAVLDQRAHDLLDEEWVTGGPLLYLLG